MGIGMEILHLQYIHRDRCQEDVPTTKHAHAFHNTNPADTIPNFSLVRLHFNICDTAQSVLEYHFVLMVEEVYQHQI